MISLIGLYANSCYIFSNDIDDNSKSFLQNYIDNEISSGQDIKIMPDVHYAKNTIIGFTANNNGRINPEIIGSDIACGVICAKLKYQNPIDLEALDAHIVQKIRTKTKSTISNTVAYNKYADELDVIIDEICNIIHKDTKDIKRSFCVLGGGNHFIELNIDDNKQLYITVHSGSGMLGGLVCDFFRSKLPSSDIYSYLSNSDRDLYIQCCNLVEKFSYLNKLSIVNIISEFIDNEVDKIIYSVHNIIKNDYVRKGSIELIPDNECIIPMNMAYGSYIAMPKKEKLQEWNYSAPHGAGRKMSRTDAKATLMLSKFQDDMKTANVYSSRVDSKRLDESPDAYKDPNIILNDINKIVDVITHIRPIYNFKG